MNKRIRVLAAAERALRSARSVQVQVEVDYKDKDGPIRMNMRFTRRKDAAGWIEQAGTRMNLVATGGKYHVPAASPGSSRVTPSWPG